MIFNPWKSACWHEFIKTRKYYYDSHHAEDMFSSSHNTHIIREVKHALTDVYVPSDE